MSDYWNRLGELSEIMIVKDGTPRGLFHEVYARVRALDGLLPPMTFKSAPGLYVAQGAVRELDGKDLCMALEEMGDDRLLHVRDVMLPALVEELIAAFKRRDA